MRRLERLDKDEYLEEERNEAEDIYEQRRQKEQELATASNSSENGGAFDVDKTEDADAEE